MSTNMNVSVTLRLVDQFTTGVRAFQEIGRGTYSSVGPTLSRDTVLLSKIGGTVGTSKINLRKRLGILYRGQRRLRRQRFFRGHVA
jgi:hypothetical protein